MKDETSSIKVLIIDDEPEVANLVKLILTRKCGDAVHIASGASAGLRIAEQEQPQEVLAARATVLRGDVYYPLLPEESNGQ